MTKAATADIAVIIVNYGTAARPRGGGQRADARARRPAVDVHLVDNASPRRRGSRPLAAEIATRGWETRVTLYAEAENHGFGRGNNLVLQGAGRAARRRPSFVFLLNPDARLKNEAIAILADFLDPTPGRGGGRADREAGRHPGHRSLPLPGPDQHLFVGAGFGPRRPRAFARQVPLAPNRPTGPVDWVAGAAVMLRLSGVIQTAGFFDPAYFLYYEEVDLMRRLTELGWRVWYVAEAQVLHAEGAATGVKGGGPNAAACRPTGTIRGGTTS